MWKNIWSKVFLQRTHVQLQILNLCRPLGSIHCLVTNIWCNLSSDISPLQTGVIFQVVHCSIYHFVCGWVRDIALQCGFHVPGCQTMYKCQVFLVSASSLLHDSRLPVCISSPGYKITVSHFTREWKCFPSKWSFSFQTVL